MQTVVYSSQHYGEGRWSALGSVDTVLCKAARPRGLQIAPRKADELTLGRFRASTVHWWPAIKTSPNFARTMSVEFDLSISIANLQQKKAQT
jgi:hypothetical protein